MDTRCASSSRVWPIAIARPDLRDCEILIERDELPSAAPGEYYREDLEGFTVRNVEGAPLGVLQHFLEAPAGALMVVSGCRRARALAAGERSALEARGPGAARNRGRLAGGVLGVRIEVVTLFPALIEDALRHGVLGRALERGLLRVGTEDPRAHTQDPHRTVNDRPYGGGPGMVLKPEPLCAAIAAACRRVPAGSARIALSPQGQLLTQARVAQLARCRHGADRRPLRGH